MKPLTDAAKLLRDAADELDNLATPPVVPAVAANLADGFTRLRLINPTGYVSIKPPSFDSHRPDKIEVDQWQVYDGAKHFSGPTLHAALLACEAAHGFTDEQRTAEAAELIGAELAAF